MISRRLCFLAFAFVCVAGCNSSDTTKPTDRTTPLHPAPEAEKYLLKSEPVGVLGVSKVRAEAKDGDDVAVVGRIGGEKNPWVEGRASFLIVDPEIAPCADDEGCPTPWDYCCTPKEDLTKAMVTVKFVDSLGQVVSVDSRTLFALKELDMVVIKGKVEKGVDKFVIRAEGLFRRPMKK